MNDCVFCRVARGEINARVYYQDEDVVAFADIAPAAPTHVLIIPRRHITDINGLTDEDENLAGRLLLTARRLARELDIAEKGYRLVLNCGPDGGQTVPHLHLHLLGGRALDARMG